MITFENAFELINNLDVPEKERKFSYKYSSLLVDFNGQIIVVNRYRNMPTQEDYQRELQDDRKMYQFTSSPGAFKSVDELKIRIKEDIIEIDGLRKEKQARKLEDARMSLKIGDKWKHI